MRITFICSSLESGKDGVGDYTRRLSGELTRLGHEISLIALNEKGISDPICENQVDDESLLETLRLPHSMSWVRRVTISKKFIDSKDPEWVSLQFVSYGFHKKGLPWQLALLIIRLTRLRKVQIMFHELWLGVYGKLAFKNLVVGHFQRQLIRFLIFRVRPNCVSTTIEVYKREISFANGTIIPLFSNVRITEHNNPESDLSMIRVVHFGSFTNNLNDLTDQLTAVKELGLRAKRKIQILVIGEGGPHKKEAFRILEELFGPQQVSDLGRLSSQAISEALHSSTIGLSRADFTLFGKSGSTLAMLEHGLPVLLRGRKPNFFFLNQYKSQLMFPDYELPNTFSRAIPKSRLNQVAKQYETIFRGQV